MDKRHIIFLIGFLVIWAGVSCAILLTNSVVAQNVIPIGVILGFVVATVSGVFTLLFIEF